ncbi:MAG: methyl-accepting chemotaxis protein [Sulfuricella sp.]|nr:methyl-accepting chemotaxis protein [Sulfuricella sp.]
MFANLKVGAKLFVLTGILAIFMSAVGIIGLRGMSQTLGGMKAVYEVRTLPVIDLGKIQHLFEMNVTETLRAFQHNPDGELYKLHDHPLSEHLARIEKNVATIDQLWRKFKANPLSAEEQRQADEFEKRRATFRDEVLLPTLTALKNNDFSVETINRYLKGNRSLGKSASEALAKLVDLQVSATKEEFERATATYNTAWGISIASLAVGLALGVGLAFQIIRSITVPLGAMRAIITEVEHGGDFTRRVALTGSDEVGETARSFDVLLGSLQNTLRQVLDSVEAVSHSAHALSSTSSQVASSSVQQSEAASSMAATVEEVTASIHHISESARTALDISRKSGELSGEGGAIIHGAAAEMAQISETVRHTSVTIEELGQRSNKISAIVQVIKEVADQTNLLALNAAIEAARAGEQGRGFAVVADEVRKLAERTSKATEEITLMIDAMQHSAQEAVSTMSSAVRQVGDGVTQARSAGNAITQIKQGAEQVLDVVNDISAALDQQSSASQDISGHVERVAQMSEENSAAAHQSADAARHLEELARAMRTSVSRFRI